MLRKFGAHVRQQFVGYLALFIALGGSAYAVAANSVGTAQLKNGAVTNPKLAPESVGSGKVIDGSLAWDDLGGSLRTVVTGRCPVGSQGAPMDTVGVGGSLCLDHYARGPDQWNLALVDCAERGLRLPTLSEAWQVAHAGMLAPNVRYWTDWEDRPDTVHARHEFIRFIEDDGPGGRHSPDYTDVDDYGYNSPAKQYYYFCVTPRMHS
jgi:hypothetical protein